MKKHLSILLIMIIIVSGCSSKESNSNKVLIEKNYSKIISYCIKIAITNNTTELVNNSPVILEGKAVTEISSENSYMNETISDTTITDPNEINTPKYIATIDVLSVSKGEEFVKEKEKINIIYEACVKNDTLYLPAETLEPAHKNINYIFYLVLVDEETLDQYNKKYNEKYKKLFYLSSLNIGQINSDGNDIENKKNLDLSESDIVKMINEYSNK